MKEKANERANGHASLGKSSVEKKEAGIVTLIIDIAGIYASL
jgi:hypothetical protein